LVGGVLTALLTQDYVDLLPKHLRDPSSNSAVFGRLLKTFLLSEYRY